MVTMIFYEMKYQKYLLFFVFFGFKGTHISILWVRFEGLGLFNRGRKKREEEGKKIMGRVFPLITI